jgi:DNA-binding LacI/PurR family transcriptional regulator
VRAKRVDGFVLVRASYETQRLLSQRRLPSVVYGTLYASIERLASLTADMRQLGLELTNYLLRRDRGKIAHLSRQVTYGGDQLTIQGIAAALSAAGKGFESLDVRFVPDAEEVYLAETERLLDQQDRPTGFICRTVPMADAVRTVAENRGLVVGEDLDVTVCDYYLKPGSRARYVHGNPLISSEEQGRHLARLLIAQVKDGGDEVGHEIMPVRLETPFSTAS